MELLEHENRAKHYHNSDHVTISACNQQTQHNPLHFITISTNTYLHYMNSPWACTNSDFGAGKPHACMIKPWFHGCDASFLQNLTLASLNSRRSRREIEGEEREWPSGWEEKGEEKASWIFLVMKVLMHHLFIGEKLVSLLISPSCS